MLALVDGASLVHGTRGADRTPVAADLVPRGNPMYPASWLSSFSRRDSLPIYHRRAGKYRRFDASLMI
jgi:hypothetical protein